jgi:hypothetical protein
MFLLRPLIPSCLPQQKLSKIELYYRLRWLVHVSSHLLLDFDVIPFPYRAISDDSLHLDGKLVVFLRINGHDIEVTCL